MNLSLDPDDINWTSPHYVFVEKQGPFMQTAPKAWQEFPVTHHHYLSLRTSWRAVSFFVILLWE